MIRRDEEVTNANNLDDIFKFSKDFKTLDKSEQSKIIENMLEENPEIKEIVNSIAGNVINLSKKIKPNINKIKNVLDYFDEIRPLFDELVNLRPFADIKTKKEIDNIFDSELCSIEELKQLIKKIDSKVKYMTIHQSKEMNTITNGFGNFNKDTCIVEMYSDNGAVIANNLTYEISNFKWLKKEISISTSKLLVYSVNKLNFNNNISKFTFNEYADMRGIDRNQVNRNKLKQDLKILENMGRIKYESTHKKDNDLILSTLVIEATYKNGNVLIEFNPKFVEGLKNTYMYFPKSLMKLNGKEFKNVFLLGWYMFTQLRTNFTTTLTRSVKSCLEQLSLPKKEDITDRHYQKRIIEPFEKIIEVLGNEVPELYITFDRDYKNINEFLEAMIKIEFKNNTISQLYIDQQRKKKSKSIKYNTENKEANIKLCKQYIKEGKTDKEISDLLKKDMRTIRRYKADIIKRTQYKNNNNKIQG